MGNENGKEQTKEKMEVVRGGWFDGKKNERRNIKDSSEGVFSLLA